MANASSKQPILCVAGPTACGKTSLALAIARVLPCEIINADSRQIYADFPIICAQPTAEERATVPHHLYGILPVTEKISAGAWCRLALDVISAVLARGHVPLLVGGTGMYFQSLLHGIVAIPPIDPLVRDRLEARIAVEGPLVLYEDLLAKDPTYAAKIHPHDRQRIVRALEVLEHTGKTFSWWLSQREVYPPKVVGPLYVLRAPLPWLEPRIAKRIEEMLDQGAIEEVRSAYARTPDPTAPGWSGIGCAELLAYVLGRISLACAKELWQKNTRAYAKRQNTWFRGRAEAIFFEPAEQETLLSRVVRDWQMLVEGGDLCQKSNKIV